MVVFPEMKCEKMGEKLRHPYLKSNHNLAKVKTKGSLDIAALIIVKKISL
jgi:hypothetical protein